MKRFDFLPKWANIIFWIVLALILIAGAILLWRSCNAPPPPPPPPPTETQPYPPPPTPIPPTPPPPVPTPYPTEPPPLPTEPPLPPTPVPTPQPPTPLPEMIRLQPCGCHWDEYDNLVCVATYKGVQYYWRGNCPLVSK